LVSSTTTFDAEISEPPYDSRAFLAKLDQLSTNEFGIGFVYSVLELLARQYHLVDVVVVVGDDSLGMQSFRLDRKKVSSDSLVTVPGVVSEPDLVPDVVKDVVRSVCQLALSLHVARHGAAHDRLTNIANRRYFDSALRTAARSERPVRMEVHAGVGRCERLPGHK
jgi:GGDEF domain-containing protein